MNSQIMLQVDARVTIIYICIGKRAACAMHVRCEKVIRSQSGLNSEYEVTELGGLREGGGGLGCGFG